MKNPYDEPKWTAYALGEGTESERAEMKNELAGSPEARAWVEQVQNQAADLKALLGQEESIGLTSPQQEEILEAAEEKSGRLLRMPPRFWWGLATAAAAAVALTIAMPPLFQQKDSSFEQAQVIEEKEQERSVQPTKTRDLSGTKKEVDSVSTDELMHTDVRLKPALREEPGRTLQQVEGATAQKGKQAAAKPSSIREAYAPSIDEAVLAGKTERAFSTPPPASPAIMSKRLALGGILAGNAAFIAPDGPPPTAYGPSIEHYNEIRENPFRRVSDHPLSTFSIDVDTASYANVRRFLNSGRLPPKDAVRIEELINYFDYAYQPPADETAPFTAHLEMAACPWQPEHRLVRIGLKGKVIDTADRPACNLVFLLDVSGSMQDANKLPLVKRAMSALVKQLDERDRVAIVVYAGASGLVLPSTSCADGKVVEEAMNRLRAGGSTNGGAGIELAYRTAREHFRDDGVNRVIVCTDGDFNVGTTQSGDLVRLIEEKAKGGVFLSVLGFGMGNYKDSTLEQLADKGNGNYAYIDTFSEARKVLVDQLTGTLVTIAKDVKIQVEFNPAHVSGYRLIGYENRMLKKEDFNDDTKDAGEIGAGHAVTALYQVVPAGANVPGAPPVDALKYQAEERPRSAEPDQTEWLNVKIRYKQPDGDTSSKLEFPLNGNDRSFEQASGDFRFATAVAGFGQLLRGSHQAGDTTYDWVIETADASTGADRFGYRRAFIDLARNARALAPKKTEQ